MKLKPNLLKLFELILHLLGFPLLLIISIIMNIKVMKYGAQYGIYAFVFMIIVILFAVIYYVAYFILVGQEKKIRDDSAKKDASSKNENIEFKKKSKADSKSKVDPGRRTGVVLAIIAVCCLSGFWALFDIGVPNILADKGTKRTIFYEDLADGWLDRAEVNKEILDTYITRAYYSGKLTKKTLDQYLKEGYKNDEVKAVMKADYSSINDNGFASYIGPGVDFAQNGRMTINAIVHILLDNREPLKNDAGNRKDSKILLNTYKVAYVNAEQETQKQNDKTINEGDTYSYIRSNGSYYLYDGTFEKAGTALKGLLIYDEFEGYKQVQYLAGNSGLDSYILTAEINDGMLKFSELVYYKDKLTNSYTLIQTSSSSMKAIVYSAEDGTEEFDIQGPGIVTKDNGVYTINVPEDVDASAIEANTANTFLASDKETIFAQEDSPSALNDLVCVVKSTVEEYATWDIFDMLGTDTTFDLPIAAIRDINLKELLNNDAFNITGAKLLDEFTFVIDDVFTAVGAMLSDPNVIGSSVTISLDTQTGTLAISPCNEQRGTLDYMRQAWLDANGLLYMIVSLFSLRKIFLIYAGILALISFVIGIIREALGQAQPESQTDESQPQVPDDDTPVDNLDVQ